MKNVIKKFSIFGLFNQYKVEIPIIDDVKILIGENGLGKTQVLNILYLTLSKKFDKLSRYSFSEVEIVFNDNSKLRIERDEIAKLNDPRHFHPIIKELIDNIGFRDFERLRREILQFEIPRFEFENHPIIRRARKIAPSEFMYELIRDMSHGSRYSISENKKIDKWKEKINEKIGDFQVLYFPTFRRVEEDLISLGYSEEQFRLSREDNRLIHFGMDDVQRRFDGLTKSIDRLSKDGFARISSEILSQLAKGKPTIDEKFLNSINHTDIEIILARAGDQISVEDKKRILEKVNHKQIKDIDPYLFYFLQKIINIYDQQRDLDTLIKGFVQVANKYLVNKEIVYDESNIDIYIKLKNREDKLLLSKLSSGEKQIVSILSRIYLSSNQNFIVLFDEPELSLSIFWQKELLPDIMNSNRCKFLFAVTHSPFIFENELDKYAISLNEFITEESI